MCEVVVLLLFTEALGGDGGLRVDALLYDD